MGEACHTKRIPGAMFGDLARDQETWFSLGLHVTVYPSVPQFPLLLRVGWTKASKERLL